MWINKLNAIFYSDFRYRNIFDAGGFFLYVKFSKCDSGFKSIYLISGHANFLGKRYMKNNDPAVILIYDVNGYIAGIQAGVCSCLIIVILAVLNWAIYIHKEYSHAILDVSLTP